MAGNHRTGLIALRGVLSTMELCLVCLTPLSKSNFRSTRGDIKDFHTGKRREPSLDHLWRRGFFANLTVECGRSALMGVLCANPSPSRVIMEHSGNGVTCFESRYVLGMLIRGCCRVFLKSFQGCSCGSCS